MSPSEEGGGQRQQLTTTDELPLFCKRRETPPSHLAPIAEEASMKRGIRTSPSGLPYTKHTLTTISLHGRPATLSNAFAAAGMGNTIALSADLAPSC